MHQDLRVQRLETYLLNDSPKDKLKGGEGNFTKPMNTWNKSLNLQKQEETVFNLKVDWVNKNKEKEMRKWLTIDAEIREYASHFIQGGINTPCCKRDIQRLRCSLRRMNIIFIFKHCPLDHQMSFLYLDIFLNKAKYFWKRPLILFIVPSLEITNFIIDSIGISTPKFKQVL